VNAQAAVDLVADAMGVRPRPMADLTKVKLLLLRDEVSLAWRQRFINECGDPNYIDMPDLLSVTL